MLIQKKGISLHHYWGYKLKQKLRKTVWSVCQKLKLELPHDSAILLQDIYSREFEQIYQSYLHSHDYCNDIQDKNESVFISTYS